jgi:hypothetical protein
MLVTPGLIFELLRRRARPKIERSAFEEISVVVVTSICSRRSALVWSFS